MNAGDQRAFATARRVAQSSYSKLVAYIAKQTRDVAAAEDALSEAFAAALRDWPETGVPDRPEAWLLAVARRKLIDRIRLRKRDESGAVHLQMLADEMEEMFEAERIIPDERLALMFACAHPAIDETVRSPLILQTIMGFTAEDIGSAFLVAPSTMGQRLSRAKAKMKLAGIPFRVPEREELPERLDAVLEAVYAAFSTTWIDPARGSNDLAEEAIWLGRLICELMPDEAEALGLTALMLFLHSRRDARRGDNGEFVPLSEQSTARWNAGLIANAENLLMQAQALGNVGRYQLEAAIQSVHAARAKSGRTDWSAILLLYGGLFDRFPSPVVALNRAVAQAEVFGAAAGLALLPELSDSPELTEFQPYWAARAELMARLGRRVDAAAAYEMAVGLATDQSQREFLIVRRAALTAPTSNVQDLRPNLQAREQT